MPRRIQIPKATHRRGDGGDGNTPDDINTGKVDSAKEASLAAARVTDRIDRLIGR